MKKHGWVLFAGVIFFNGVSVAEGISPYPGPIEVQQPDGTSVKVYFRGDRYEDSKNFPILREEKTYYYARVVDGKLVADKNLPVGKSDPLTAGLSPNLGPVGAAGLPKIERVAEPIAYLPQPKPAGAAFPKADGGFRVRIQDFGSATDGQAVAKPIREKTVTLSPAESENVYVLLDATEIKQQEHSYQKFGRQINCSRGELVNPNGAVVTNTYRCTFTVNNDGQIEID